MNLGRLTGFLVLGEQKIFHEILPILNTAHDATEAMTRLLSQPETIAAETERIKDLEKRSDELAFAIKHDVMNGAINPTVLDDLLQCVDVADSILDDYYYLAREASRMAHLQSGEDRNRMSIFQSDFLSTLRLITKSLGTLQQILEATDLDQVRKERRAIEVLEEEGDEIKDAAFDKLYGLASKIQYLLFTHYSLVLHKLDDILDSCEDLSDLLLAIMAAISK